MSTACSPKLQSPNNFILYQLNNVFANNHNIKIKIIKSYNFS